MGSARTPGDLIEASDAHGGAMWTSPVRVAPP